MNSKPEATWPTLDKTAQVGAARFHVGVSSKLVVEAAQRNFEYQNTPENEAACIERAELLRSVINSNPEARIAELEAENARLTAELEKQKAVSLDIDTIIRDICELPDRSSPEDDPEAMLVTADELKAVLLSNSLPFQPLNIDDISDKTILKIVGAFWRRAVPREIPQPESIVSITAMRTSLMWIDMDRYEAVEFAKNQSVVFAVDSEGGHCD